MILFNPLSQPLTLVPTSTSTCRLNLDFRIKRLVVFFHLSWYLCRKIALKNVQRLLCIWLPVCILDILQQESQQGWTVHFPLLISLLGSVTQEVEWQELYLLGNSAPGVQLGLSSRRHRQDTGKGQRYFCPLSPLCWARDCQCLHFHQHTQILSKAFSHHFWFLKTACSTSKRTLTLSHLRQSLSPPKVAASHCCWPLNHWPSFPNPT